MGYAVQEVSIEKGINLISLVPGFQAWGGRYRPVIETHFIGKKISTVELAYGDFEAKRSDDADKRALDIAIAALPFYENEVGNKLLEALRRRD